ncbi:steroid 3-ketoacyl-CoA thiolase, partial [Streptomyces sp. NPDC058964]
GGRGAGVNSPAYFQREGPDKEFALITMCAGGGLATGTIIQRL